VGATGIPPVSAVSDVDVDFGTAAASALPGAATSAAEAAPKPEAKVGVGRIVASEIEACTEYVSKSGIE
jgi:hypothetical protein